MKTFSQFLNEAYSTEMKNVFSKEQLSKLGKIFNERYNISVQNSNFKHYTAKTFKVKFGAENGFAICRLLDGSYVILGIESPRSYVVTGIEKKGRYFSNPKDVIKQSTDIFVFETLSMNKDLKDTRKENNKQINKVDLKELIPNKRKILRNNYVVSINNKINKYDCGFHELLYITDNNGKNKRIRARFLDETYNPYDSKKSISSVFTEEDGLKLNNQIHWKRFVVEDNIQKETTTIIKSLKRCKEILKILNSIDYTKLPIVTEEEYYKYNSDKDKYDSFLEQL